MGPSSLQLRLRVQQLRWKRFAGSWVLHKRRVILGFFYPLLFVLSFLPPHVSWEQENRLSYFASYRIVCFRA